MSLEVTVADEFSAMDPATEEMLASRLIELSAERLAISADGVEELAEQLGQVRDDFARFRMYYQFGIEEIRPS